MGIETATDRQVDQQIDLEHTFGGGGRRVGEEEEEEEGGVTSLYCSVPASRPLFRPRGDARVASLINFSQS